MSVSIEEVLALLPVLFPGTQQIPLKNIRPNPKNPGPPITDDEIQDLADNISQSGLLNPIKVRPDRANPLAGGAQLHPDNPRLRGDGKPWSIEDFNFEILAGENRYRAFGRLQRETIPGFVLNPTAKEAVKITHLDNDVRDRGWWAAYQSIEQLIQADPNLTQRQVAVELKMDAGRVNRALGLLPLLNPGARELIVANCNNSNKGIWGISESATLRLADLGPGTGLKPGVKKKAPITGSSLDPVLANHGPRLVASAQLGAETQKLWPYPPIPAETQDKVKRTLAVAIDQELTEQGVKGLVSWVQEGHDPEDYGSESQGTSKPVTNKATNNLPEYKQVPVSRTRLNRILKYVFRHQDRIDRKALAMKTTGSALEISVRPLTVEEKAADPDHDYELFDRPLELEGARKLGWPTLNALVYEMDELEAVHEVSFRQRHSHPLTWIEVYAAMENILADDPEKTLAELAIELEEDPDLAQQVYPVVKLLNDSAIIAIAKSIHKCSEDGIDMGGYRFVRHLAIPLIRLEKISKDPVETQKIVEKVVNVAIENEMGTSEIEELIDWVWDGNEPEEFYVKEA